MKRYAKPQTALDKVTQGEASTDMTPPPPIADISVVRLIDDGLVALYREMKNLLVMSSKGKMDPANARDLRDYMKLLFDLKAQEADSLSKVSDEELKAQAKAALGEET
jgi:hypothetical protein